MTVSLPHLVLNAKQIRGSYVGSQQDLKDMLATLKDKKVLVLKF